MDNRNHSTDIKNHTNFIFKSKWGDGRNLMERVLITKSNFPKQDLIREEGLIERRTGIKEILPYTYTCTISTTSIL